MAVEIDEGKLYYFTALVGGVYQTVFISWLKRDFVKAFELVDGVSSFAHIRLSVGEHIFISNVSAPLYLLNYENDDIFEFAGDNNELQLYSSGDIPPDLDMEPVIDFPSYFVKGVEPLIEFKLDKGYWIRREGIWILLEV